jgi:uncharacterized protein
VSRPRRRSWCRRRRVVIALALVAAALAVDALLIGPRALVVSTHTVGAPVAAPLTVVQLSDLHTTGFGSLERAVVDRVAEARPDVVVVTGDVVDSGDLEPARALFTRLHAPLGVFVVRGNWENWRPPPGEAAFYASVGATLLVNDGRLVRPDVWIAGVDDPLSGPADFAAATAAAGAGALRIVLVHSPAAFDVSARDGDLVLAGHTHGGQVRLPLVGALWTPPGSGRFVEGWYDGRGGARLFVSRGIGTSILPVRFLCAPEVARIVVVPR